MLDLAFSVGENRKQTELLMEIIIGIHAKLTKDGAKDIDLLVHSYYIGHPSPCVVITDWSTRSGIGGSIDSLDQIFDIEVAKYPGYVVNERVNIVAEMNPAEIAADIPTQTAQEPRER
jgi:hypothetical protein